MEGFGTNFKRGLQLAKRSVLSAAGVCGLRDRSRPEPLNTKKRSSAPHDRLAMARVSALSGICACPPCEADCTKSAPPSPLSMFVTSFEGTFSDSTESPLMAARIWTSAGNMHSRFERPNSWRHPKPRQKTQTWLLGTCAEDKVVQRMAVAVDHPPCCAGRSEQQHRNHEPVALALDGHCMSMRPLLVCSRGYQAPENSTVSDDRAHSVPQPCFLAFTGAGEQPGRALAGHLLSASACSSTLYRHG